MLSLLLISIPTIAALLVWLLGQNSKLLALASSIVVAMLAVYICSTFTADASSQFAVSFSWVKSLNLSFHLGIDGVSLVLVLLTAIAIPLIVLSTFDQPTQKPALFYALILFMQAALMGVFMAKDIFLFYFFFEVTLIPVYFLSAIWGGPNRIAVTFKFFVYTVFGSLFMLLALVYLYYQTPGSHSALITDLYQLSLSPSQQSLIFAAIFLAFAIKMPLFPFHTWQPDTYTEAPTAGSMLLSGVMLKMGTYGLIRILLPIVPVASTQWGYIAIILAIIGIIYGSIIAIGQNHLKRIIAFSSFAHVGLMAAGIFTKSTEGLQGSLIQMLAHGINVIGLFFIAEIIQRRTGTFDIQALGGIAQKAKKFTVYFIIIMLGSVALPLTNGFVGEFLLLKSLFDHNVWLAAIAGLSIILGAVYMLRMVQKTTFGPSNKLTENFSDLTVSENITLLTIAALVLVLGIFPNTILKLSEPAVSQLLTIINK
jgi:NADH-quinone oxidoreductase subunit M